MFAVSCLGIWWRHNIWMSEKLKFDYLKCEKSFLSEIKIFFLVSKMPSFRLTKQSSKYVADTTFKKPEMSCLKISNINLINKQTSKYFQETLLFRYYFILCLWYLFLGNLKSFYSLISCVPSGFWKLLVTTNIKTQIVPKKPFAMHVPRLSNMFSIYFKLTQLHR